MVLDLELRHFDSEGKIPKEHKQAVKKIENTFEREYQRWYLEAFAVLKQLAPDRLAEFEILYKGDGKRKAVDVVTFNIQDWLNGVRAGTDYLGKKHFNDLATVSMRFKTQQAIVEATGRRLDSSLFDIRQLVQADIFDSELDSARELLKHGYVRGAGAIGGVVLEKHLSQVTQNHKVSIRKQHPSINDLNEALKNGGVLDIPAWRGIQRLGDLRNLCDHNKDREPTKEDIRELIDGVEKITKTLF